jgi:hypothetical protein
MNDLQLTAQTLSGNDSRFPLQRFMIDVCGTLLIGKLQSTSLPDRLWSLGRLAGGSHHGYLLSIWSARCDWFMASNKQSSRNLALGGQRCRARVWRTKPLYAGTGLGVKERGSLRPMPSVLHHIWCPGLASDNA